MVVYSFTNHFIANCPVSVPVKEFSKYLAKIWTVTSGTFSETYARLKNYNFGSDFEVTWVLNAMFNDIVISNVVCCNRGGGRQVRHDLEFGYEGHLGPQSYKPWQIQHYYLVSGRSMLTCWFGRLIFKHFSLKGKLVFMTVSSRYFY